MGMTCDFRERPSYHRHPEVRAKRTIASRLCFRLSKPARADAPASSTSARGYSRCLRWVINEPPSAGLAMAACAFAMMGDVRTYEARNKRASMVMLKSEVHYFPEADDPAIAPFARAFVRMMFAHAELEARIRALQGVLTGDPTYGDMHSWSARDCPRRMRRLVVKKCGLILEADDIRDCLKRAIPLCDDRNHLAHGQWWAFDRNAGTITVRRGRHFWNKDQHKDFSADDIEHVASALSDIEVDLYKHQAAIEAQFPNDS
jgi:hypothetical protein